MDNMEQKTLEEILAEVRRIRKNQERGWLLIKLILFVFVVLPILLAILKYTTP